VCNSILILHAVVIYTTASGEWYISFTCGLEGPPCPTFCTDSFPIWQTQSRNISFIATIQISVNTFLDVAVSRWYEIFSFMMSLWQFPLEIGYPWAERVGEGEVGECAQRVQTVWPRLGSALKTLAGTGWVTSILLCINGLRKTGLSLCRIPISVFFSVWTSSWHTESHRKVINGSVWF